MRKRQRTGNWRHASRFIKSTWKQLAMGSYTLRQMAAKVNNKKKFSFLYFTSQRNLHDVLGRAVDGKRRQIAVHHRAGQGNDRPAHGTSRGGLCGDVRESVAERHAGAVRHRRAAAERLSYNWFDLKRLSLLRLSVLDGPSRFPCYLLHLFGWLSIGSGSCFLLRWSTCTKPKAGNIGEAMAGKWRLVGAGFEKLFWDHHHRSPGRIGEVLGRRVGLAPRALQAQNGEDFREAQNTLARWLLRRGSLSYPSYIVMCWIKVSLMVLRLMAVE